MSNITQYPLELEHKLNGFHFKKQPSIKIRRYLERVKKKKSTEEFDRYWNVKLSLVDKIEAYCTRVESANGADFQMTVNIKKLIIDYDGRMNNITHCDLGGGNSFWQVLCPCIRGTNSEWKRNRYWNSFFITTSSPMAGMYSSTSTSRVLLTSS